MFVKMFGMLMLLLFVFMFFSVFLIDFGCSGRLRINVCLWIMFIWWERMVVGIKCRLIWCICLLKSGILWLVMVRVVFGVML